MPETYLQCAGIGWVLPSGHGSGFPDFAAINPGTEQELQPGQLEGFKAAPFLSSVKGYLDPAGAYSLAAAALALGKTCPTGTEINAAQAGICSVTTYGWTKSAFTFFGQFLDKGARLASPMIFPHGYSSTAGNLAAIEFGFAGPHMVFCGGEVNSALDFTAAQLLKGSAADMLVIVCEAVEPQAVADSIQVLNGAAALWLKPDTDPKPAPETKKICIEKLLNELQRQDPEAAAGCLKPFLDILKQI